MFQILLFNLYSFIDTQWNGFKYCYVTLTVYLNSIVKAFQELLINTNNSIQHYSFISTQLNCSEYYYVLPKIQLNISHRMLRAILNKSWQQHPTRHQLYGHLPPITKTIQVRQTRHAGHCWRSRDELISDVLLWTLHIWPSKSRTTSMNIHSATMWGYGM